VLGILFEVDGDDLVLANGLRDAVVANAECVVE